MRLRREREGLAFIVYNIHMKIIYTKHAEEKLQRTDIKSFKINKKLIVKIIDKPELSTKTKYGDYAAIGNLDKDHILRIIYSDRTKRNFRGRPDNRTNIAPLVCS